MKNSTDNKKYLENKKKRREIYNSKEWIHLSRLKRQDQPLCEMCLKNDRVTPSNQVHHIKSFLTKEGNIDYDLAYDYNNLMSLCTDCHVMIHCHNDGRKKRKVWEDYYEEKNNLKKND